MCTATHGRLGHWAGGLAVLIRKPGEKLLVFLMGLAAGIMIMLSFLELLFESLKIGGLFLATSGFMAGSLVLFFLDFLLPHEHFSVSEKGVLDTKILRDARILKRQGLLIAIGISLHNLPEGIAVASGYSYVPRIGLIIAIAIALHNIPGRCGNCLANSHEWSSQMGSIPSSLDFRID